MSDVTHLLHAIEAGHPRAAQDLLPLVFQQLRQLAAKQMAQERPGQTLDPTALVHEAYVRLVKDPQADNWANRRHFVAAAAEAMRRILVENARRKGRLKHGGGKRRAVVDLDGMQGASPTDDLIALHEALEQFAAHDTLKAKLVELRFFGGLTLEQAAQCLGMSLSTADRNWRYARAWLYAAMAGKSPENN